MSSAWSVSIPYEMYLLCDKSVNRQYKHAWHGTQVMAIQFIITSLAHEHAQAHKHKLRNPCKHI